MGTKNTVRLAKNEGCWRVDGFGEISNFDGKTPQIDVCFSQVNLESGNKAHQASSLTNKHLNLKYSLAAIKRFSIGSVWKDGKRISNPENIAQSFHIDTSKVRFYRLKDSIQLNRNKVDYIIPSHYFKVGKNLKHLINTYYALVPVIFDNSTEWLVIPCSELFRFYLGVSDRFCNKLAYSKLEKYVDWDKSIADAKKPVLHIKERMSRAESFVLMRSLASKLGNECLRTNHKYLSSINSQNKTLREYEKSPLVIKSVFPFNDKTIVSVSGKKFPFKSSQPDGKDEWAVFVMQLNRCSYPASFFNSTIACDDLYQKPNGGSVKGAGNGLIQDEEIFEDDYSENELPADANIKRTGIYNPTNQFAAMESWRPEYSHNHANGRFSVIPSDQKEAKGYTFEEGNYENESEGNLGVSNFDSHIDSVDRELSNFIDMVIQLKHLVKSKKWTVKTRALDAHLSVSNEIVTAFPNMGNKRRRWHLIGEKDNKVNRQVVWVEININKDMYLYLVEVELKPSESGMSTVLIIPNDFHSLGDELFRKFLKLTTIQNGWPTPRENKKNDGHLKKTRELFSLLKLVRLTHPNASKLDQEKNIRVPLKVNPEDWAIFFREKIVEELLNANILFD